MPDLPPAPPLDASPQPFEVTLIHKAGSDNGWHRAAAPGTLDAPPWMTLTSHNADGSVRLARAVDGSCALQADAPIMRGLEAEGHEWHATPDGPAVLAPDLDALHRLCRRAWQLAREPADTPADTLSARLAREGVARGPDGDELNPASTTREATVRLRVGQDVFRAALDDYWGCCPLTGIADRALLRASHIVPWRLCESDAERLDVHNGLLLAAHWDAAFDAGLVTFDDEGRAVASPHLSPEARAALAPEAAVLPLTDGHKKRLARHRAEIFRG